MYFLTSEPTECVILRIRDYCATDATQTYDSFAADGVHLTEITERTVTIANPVGVTAKFQRHRAIVMRMMHVQVSVHRHICWQIFARAHDGERIF